MSKTKKEFNNAILKWFYGVENMDEYRYQQVAIIGNNCFRMLFFGSFASVMIGFGLSYINSDWGIYFLVFSQLILLALATIYLSHQCQKRGFLTVEVLPEDYEAEKAKRLKRNLRNSLVYFFVYTIFRSFMDNGFNLPRFWADVIDMPKMINTLILTLIFHHFTKKQLLKNLQVLDEAAA